MSATPTVSVIIPAYRAARYLAAAMESILMQSYTDFELILVYDRSDDGTEEIIKQFEKADQRVRIIENYSKKQLAAALNVGLASCRGQFIARMDADDIATPQRFATQVDFLQRNPDVALCGTCADIIDKDGKTIGHYTRPTGPERVRIYAQYSAPLFHPTWMMRRMLPESLGGYRDMSFGEDYDFQLRALDAGFILDNIPITGLSYRRDPSHRARLATHKAANYAYEMHRLRQRGMPDGFSGAAFQAAIRPASWAAKEKLGQRWVQRGFEMSDHGNLLAPLVVGAGLLLLPSSAYLSWRRLKTTVKLKAHSLARA